MNVKIKNSRNGIQEVIYDINILKLIILNNVWNFICRSKKKRYLIF